MSNIGKTFGTDKDLENGSGVTLEYPDFTITIHRAGGSNKKYNQLLENKMKPHQKAFKAGRLDNEIGERILLEAFAEGVVVGWSGVKDDQGKNLPFTVERCIKEFQENPDFYADVKEQALDMQTFRQEQEAVIEKN